MGRFAFIVAGCGGMDSLSGRWRLSGAVLAIIGIGMVWSGGRRAVKRWRAEEARRQ